MPQTAGGASAVHDGNKQLDLLKSMLTPRCEFMTSRPNEKARELECERGWCLCDL
jgi:hypothetical protein